MRVGHFREFGEKSSCRSEGTFGETFGATRKATFRRCRRDDDRRDKPILRRCRRDVDRRDRYSGDGVNDGG
jgi:hypothetical protein